MGSVPPTDHAFNVAILRVLETGVGIVAYTLVTVLLWPSNTQRALDAAVRRLAETQHALYRGYRQLLGGEDSQEDSGALRMQKVWQLNQFVEALASARTDSYEVGEVRRQWQQVQAQASDVMQTLEQWRESFADVKDLDLGALLPTLDEFAEELDARFEQIGRMLAGQSPARLPETRGLSWDRGAVRSLTHFQRAALG
jgi:uncharacterized membrane protein YccC